MLSNINSNLSYKYLKFCLRYFTYFRLDLLDIKVDSYINQLNIRNNLRQEEDLNITNSLAIRYSKSNRLEEVESSTSNSIRKHSRQVSSINSNSLVINKRLKTLDLLYLSSLGLDSSILTRLLQDFLNNPSTSFRSLE